MFLVSPTFILTTTTKPNLIAAIHIVGIMYAFSEVIRVCREKLNVGKIPLDVN